jgi:cytochrome o ubiquinol oxidase subunit 1
VFGKLTWEAIPFDQPIPLVTSAVLIVVLTGLLLWVAVKGYIPYLWKEWITSVDHKRIGIMYCLLALVMLLRGFSDALMMRSQQALAFNAPGYLPPEHYDQIFSAHGTIMIFFVAMPFVVGLMNFAVPLQLGVRDVAFPTLNSVSFWLTAAGALLVNVSLVVGEFARTGWLPFPPLSELTYSPGVGVDYYAWSLELSGIGTLMAGINMVTTILKMRAPGMSYTRMPVFCWTSLASNLLIVAAFPILTASLAMLLLDRYVGFHFFTNEAGGNPMMFMNLIWAWGHPEVYILVLPAFGVFSEVIATFSSKPLFGYRSMVIATMAICLLSFLVWLHHFFTMGPGGDVNGFFGIMSMIIAIPTGVKLFNWLFTMYGGRVRFTSPMLWAVGFMVTFALGGMTGVLLAVPPADFVLHNSLFLVAHFHNVIIGGVLFGAFAGYTYWFPKAFGFSLDERLGKAAFWCWFVGFYVAFMPLYVLGLLGMTRRMQHYTQPEWYPWVLVAGLGALIVLTGIILQVTQLTVSIRTRAHRRELTGDPWDGRTLEWATSSPPPAYNFAVLHNVESEEPYWGMKLEARENLHLLAEPKYEAIEVPRNSPTGFITAFFAVVTGFSLIWHIWWLVVLGLVGAYATFVVLAWRDVVETTIPVEEVAREDRANRAARLDALRAAGRAKRPQAQEALA